MQLIESETLELKKSTSELKAGVVSLVAMLNKHHRGELWFGIKNDGTAVGQSISEASLREVSRAMGDHIEPKVYPSVEKVMVDKKHCIVSGYWWRGKKFLIMPMAEPTSG